MEGAALLKAIIENAIDGIITIDDRGSIESINPAGCSLFQYTPGEVIGKNVSSLMPAPDRESHDGYIARYQRTMEPHIIGIGREVMGGANVCLDLPEGLLMVTRADKVSGG